MDYLKLEIFDLEGNGSKFAALPDDTVITIVDTSEIFASGDLWSYSFKLNISANANIFGSAGEMHGQRLHYVIHHRKARLWIMGTPMYLGFLTCGAQASVSAGGDVDVTFESGQKTFDDMISGARANQVPMMTDVQIGMALWRKRWIRYRLAFKVGINVNQTYFDTWLRDAVGDNLIPLDCEGENDVTPVQEYPRMVYPKGTFVNDMTHQSASYNFLNTDHAYDDSHPYCNIALCYQRQGYEKKMADGSIVEDYSSEPEPQRGYEIMPANRVNSAPNFFVIYWIRALMKHLGIHIDENQMMEMEDLRRLFFVNTNCDYVEPKKIRTEYNERFGRYHSNAAGRLLAERLKAEQNIDFNESKVEVTSFRITDWYAPSLYPQPDKLYIKASHVNDWKDSDKEEYISRNSIFHKAFATSKCFPDVEISDVISAIENGFGVRFLFSDSYRRVRIVLLRNIFRSQEVQTLDGDVISISKQENNIRGFRMTYGDIDDTHYYYKGFADKLPHKKELWPETEDDHDYSQWDLDAVYAEIIKKATAFNKVCYVTKNTGNAYGVKIDKNARRYEDLHPSIFEYAGFMDAEDGDCTGEDDTIKSVNVGFAPIIMNDCNYEQEVNGETDQQKLTLFVDETMRARRPDLQDGQDYNNPDSVYDVDNVLYHSTAAGIAQNYTYSKMMGDDGIVKPGEFSIKSDVPYVTNGLKATFQMPGGTVVGRAADIVIEGHINEGYRLYLQDNFSPNDEGVSPIETHGWDLTLGIMRGSGSDAQVSYTPDPDDGENNMTWDIVPGGSATASADVCDNYGRIFPYGDGSMDGRFSLKLRAEKPNPYFNPALPESETNRRYLEITNADLRRRGLADKFYREYSKFIREARIAKVEVDLKLAQLLTLDKTVKVRVGDIMGFVRKIEYSVSMKEGLKIAKLEIMYI